MYDVHTDGLVGGLSGWMDGCCC